jgi:hypothetical protein
LKIVKIIIVFLIMILPLSCKNSDDEDPIEETEEEIEEDIPVTGVSLNKASSSIATGDTEQLLATVIPVDATNQNVTWSSSDNSVAAVSSSGLVTAKDIGTTVITVTTNESGFSATCTITIVYGAGYQLACIMGGLVINIRYVPGKTSFIGITDSNTATVTDDFWIAETEVTYEQWYAVYNWAVNGTGGAAGEGQYSFANPGVMGDGKGAIDYTYQHPVTTINWRDAMVWMNALTECYNENNDSAEDLECVYYADIFYKNPIRSCDNSDTVSDKIKGSQDYPYIKPGANGFRLPTSNEWELAARYIIDANHDGDICDIGEYYPWHYASGATDNFENMAANDLVAWYSNNSNGHTHEVGKLNPNALNIYDMSGNINEWCFDWDTVGDERILHGGYYSSVNMNIVTFEVSNYPPFDSGINLGFRPARTQ